MFVGSILCRIFHCRTRSPLSFVTNDGTDHMCSSIFNPNFLLQKPLAHETESCITISTFRCVYFSVTEKWTVWQLRVCYITNIMSVYKHYVCVQTLCLCTNIMTVYKHYVCVQTLCLCTNIMSVYKHYDCVQTLCLCTNIMSVYKHYACVQTLWLCTNIMSVYKHYVCVQTLCLCTNIMSVYKHYVCVQTAALTTLDSRIRWKSSLFCYMCPEMLWIY